MGRRIYAELQNAGINVYVTGETEIDKTINLHMEGELVDDPNRPCSHNGKCKDKQRSR